MKTLNKKGHQFKAAFLVMVLGTMAPYAVFSQDALLDDANQVFNSDQIDIDGDYSQPRVSAADKMEKMRKKLEQQNEDMVNKKIEDIRTRNEQKLAKDLQKAFHGGALTDSVSTSHAAVVKAPAPVIESQSSGRSNRVIPKFGITNYDGEQNSLESNISFGVNVETDVHDRIAIGIGVQYNSFDLTVDNNNYNYYYNSVNNDVEMGYSHLNIELNSKFYLTSPDSKIRPYAGAGVGYNRSSLKYNDGGNNNFNYNYYNYNYNVEDVNSSFVSASGALGAEMGFSDSFGAVLEFRYNKSLSNITNSNRNNNNYFNNQEQRRLDDTNDDIQNSSQFAINAGFMIKF